MLRELGDFSDAKGLLFRIPKSFVSCFIENLVDAQDTRVRVVGVYPDPVVYQKACDQRTELIRKNKNAMDLWERNKKKVNVPGKWEMITVAVASLLTFPVIGLWAIVVGIGVMGVFEMFLSGSRKKRVDAWVKANAYPEKLRFPVPSFDSRLPVQQEAGLERLRHVTAQADSETHTQSLLEKKLKTIFTAMDGQVSFRPNFGGLEFTFSNSLVTLKGRLLLEHSAASLRYEYHIAKPLTPDESHNIIPIIAAFNAADDLVQWTLLGHFLQVDARAESHLDRDLWLLDFVRDVLASTVCCSVFFHLGRDQTWTTAQIIKDHRECTERLRIAREGAERFTDGRPRNIGDN